MLSLSERTIQTIDFGSSREDYLHLIEFVYNSCQVSIKLPPFEAVRLLGQHRRKGATQTRYNCLNSGQS